MLKVIISRHEHCLNRSKRIIKDSENKAELLFIEDILNDNKVKISSEDTIFILNNSPKIPLLLEKIKTSNAKLLNDKYYQSKLNKYETQQLLLANNIPAPKILSIQDLKSCSFPIYCKSIKHSSFVKKINSIDELKHKKDVYFEEDVSRLGLKEYKIYFIKDEAFFYDNEEDLKNKNLLPNLLMIRDILGLDLFSADVFMEKEKVLFIDINIASGLYHSHKARIALATKFN